MNTLGELRYWLTGFKWNVCGTLTFSPETDNGRRDRLLALLLNKLNRKLHGNKFRDEGRKCYCAVFEGNNILGTNLHYHLSFIIPDNYRGDIFSFCRLLKRLWNKICGRNKISEFEPIDDNLAWTSYITNQLGNEKSDNLNLQHSHLPTTQNC